MQKWILNTFRPERIQIPHLLVGLVFDWLLLDESLPIIQPCPPSSRIPIDEKSVPTGVAFLESNLRRHPQKMVFLSPSNDIRIVQIAVSANISHFHWKQKIAHYFSVSPITWMLHLPLKLGITSKLRKMNRLLGVFGIKIVGYACTLPWTYPPFVN